jgi:heptaprenylglyceryl phosphate synthase
VDGKTVLEYTDPQLDERDGDAKRLLEAGQDKMLRGGSISVQSESHPTEFRKIELLELPD